MATVKGDVHDIGKNIVGVVLGCNDYEVIDLGVMVPCEKILADGPRAAASDMIGLSGLITPSLDEMVHVAKEMEREGFQLPLLIGGATTSAKHTAVKIAPAITRPVIHVKDASRCVGVVDRLTRPEREAGAGPREPRRPGAGAREPSRSAAQRKLVPYAEALRAPLRHRLDGTRRSPSRRSSARACSRDFPLGEIVPYIDWSPFFMAWELKGKYPQIFNDPIVGKEATRAVRRRQAAAATASSRRSC